MKKSFCICVLMIFLAIAEVKAQIIKIPKKNKEYEQFKHTKYKPVKDRERERAIKQEKKRQLALSYHPENTPRSKANRKETREARAIQKRLKRAQLGEKQNADKKSKQSQNEFHKKYNEQEKTRKKKIKRNKKNFGTKDSRKNFNTNHSERNIIENDENKKSLNPFKNLFNKSK